jgi:tRNA nucleotidyltransferase (CCA-adding enzyme)
MTKLISQNLKNEILTGLKFSKFEKEKNKKIIKSLINLLSNDEFKILIGGSFAKRTYLKKCFDVDLFAQFQVRQENEYMSKKLKKILNKIGLEFKVEKGSRDYFSFYYKDIKFELVPTVKIDNFSNIENTTDISIFHVNFLLGKINENKVLNDEIRLTKQLFKAQGFYGAESYINGFSGHTLDLLIVHYKSLENLILNAKNWETKTVIDINNNYKSQLEILENLDKSKISNLIIIDPIQKKRNASRALSFDIYSKFVYFCKSIEKLKKEYFIIKKQDFVKDEKESLSFAKKFNLNQLVYKIDFNYGKSTKDIIGSKLLKVSKKLELCFNKLGFNVFQRDFKIDFKKNKSIIILLIENFKIPKLKKILGPSIFIEDRCLNFKEKRKKIWLCNDKLFSYKIVKKTSLKEYILFKKKDLEKLSGNNMKFIEKIDVVLNKNE